MGGIILISVIAVFTLIALVINGIIPIPFGMFASTDRKLNTEVRVNSGNSVLFKDGSTEWENLGNVVSGTLAKKGSSIEGMWSDGSKWKKRGSVEAGGTIVLGQVSKTIIDRVDELVGKILKFYIDNGLGDDNKYQEIYSPEIEIIEAYTIEMKGEAHQQLALEFSILPQASVVTVTPSTGLPLEAHSHATATLQTGKNKFWIIIETAAS